MEEHKWARFKKHWSEYLPAAVFLLILAGGGLCQLFLPDRAYSPSERRLLQRVPEFSLESVSDASYMETFETYLTDQFPLRDRWITAKTRIGLAVGMRESGGVYIAGDDCLIELHRAETFDPQLAAQNTEVLLDFAADMAAEYGAEHVRIMLIPSAQEIWRSKLPDGMALFDQSAYLEALQVRLEEEVQVSGGQTLVDVADNLAAHAEEAIYYRTDHHWTALGAYYGYVSYAQSLPRAAADGEVEGFISPSADGTVRMPEDYEWITVTENFSGTTAAKCGLYFVHDTIEVVYPRVPENYTVDHDLGYRVTDSLYDLEMAQGNDPYAVYLGGNDAIVTIQTERAEQMDWPELPSRTERRLLIVRDSYANSFVPYLTTDFSAITLVDLRYYNGSVRQLMEEGGYTDILLLYHIPNFLSERSIGKLSKE